MNQAEKKRGQEQRESQKIADAKAEFLAPREPEQEPEQEPVREKREKSEKPGLFARLFAKKEP